MDVPEPQMIKVRIVTDGQTESLWAELVTPDIARLDNAPFFAYGISADDLIEIREDLEFRGFYWFEGIREKGGSRTVRVYSEDPQIVDPAFKPVLDEIQALGCSYEGMQPRLLSITIPKEADLEAMAAFLNERELMWEYADPRYEELFGDEEVTEFQHHK